MKTSHSKRTNLLNAANVRRLVIATAIVPIRESKNLNVNTILVILSQSKVILFYLFMIVTYVSTAYFLHMNFFMIWFYLINFCLFSSISFPSNLKLLFYQQTKNTYKKTSIINLKFSFFKISCQFILFMRFACNVEYNWLYERTVYKYD